MACTDPTELFLTGLGCAQFLQAFKENGIDATNINSLTDDDLITLGVEDKEIRQKILNSDQIAPVNQLLKVPYLRIDNEYVHNVLIDAAKQLARVEACLLTSNIRMKRPKDGLLVDQLVTQELYSSQAILLASQCVFDSVEKLDIELRKLRNKVCPRFTAKQKSNEKNLKIAAVTCSTAGVLILIYAIFKIKW